MVATSYGTASRCQRDNARCSVACASPGSPSASCRRPRAEATVASTNGVANRAPSSSISATAAVAITRLPSAIATWVTAGRSRDRASDPVGVVAMHVAIAPRARSTRPSARRSSATSAHCPPQISSALANAAAAPSRSPSRRRMSPISTQADAALPR